MGIFKKDKKFSRMVMEMVSGVVSLVLTVIYFKSTECGIDWGDNILLFLCSLLTGFFILLFVCEVVRYVKMVERRVEDILRRVEEILRDSDIQKYHIRVRR